MTHDVINAIRNIESMSYLELGVAANETFRAVRAASKTSVDTNGAGTFTGTTDEFFATEGKQKVFDVVYIDANHDLDFVLRDLNNAVSRCRKWVLIHDMVPPDERHTASNFCSDSYRLLRQMLVSGGYETYTQDGNYGLTAVRMPAKKIEVSEESRNLGYGDFIREMSDMGVRLLTEKEMIEVLSK